jgi:hypothetical protein
MNKVMCVSNPPYYRGKGWERLPLTIGKIYDVIKEVHIPFSKHRYDDPSGPFYLIKCDNDEEKHFETNRFRELTLDEKRELKLEDLGI